MNKGDFLKVMGEKAGLNGAQTKKAYDAFVETLVSAMKKRRKSSTNWFCNFRVEKPCCKNWYQPNDKAKIKIAASKVPAAKFGAGFKSLFN